MKTLLAAVGLVWLAALAACGAPADAAAPQTDLRLLVKLKEASIEGAAIARAASAAAKRPVRYLSSSGGQWHVVVVRCVAGADCDAAIQRLRADVATFEAVERDALKRPAKP